MRTELLALAGKLAEAGDAFVMAVVVRREPASSAHVGNMAVVTPDGGFHGWLGGSCIRPTVVREALAALRTGEPRLVSLSPEPSAERRAGVTVFPMTCHSGGTVDVYIEPVVPAPRLVVFGVTPVAQALARLGKAMGYSVEAVDPDADAAAFPGVDRVTTTAPAVTHSGPETFRRPIFAVVATHGQRDEEAVGEALALEAAYVGVVASRKRYEQMRELLAADPKIATAALERVKSPAGLDINAKTPEEVALSILAEIVQMRRMSTMPASDEAPASVPAESARAAAVAAPQGPPSRLLTVRAVPAAVAATEAIDPVCGMTVSRAGPKHTAEHEGRTFYFCCGGCRQRFLAAPEKYLAERAGS